MFRLVNAHVRDQLEPSSRSQSVYGRVRWLETLRGDGSQFKQVAFSNHPCGGTRLEVGHYFLAAINADGTGFDGNFDNLIDITEEYVEGEHNYAPGWILDRLCPAVVGEQKFSDVIDPRMRYSTHTNPPPPPPPPSPPDVSAEH